MPPTSKPAESGILRHSAPQPRVLVKSLAFVLLAGCAVALLGAQEQEPRLQNSWSRWLEDVAPLISPEERRDFAQLETDLQKERFLLDFWQRRPGWALERFVSNRQAVQEARFRAPIHAQVVANIGKPSQVTLFEQCEDQLRRLELWHYEPWQIDLQSGALGPVLTSAGTATETGFTLALLQWSNLDPRRVEIIDPAVDFARWTYGQPGVDSLTDALELAASFGCQAGVSEIRPGTGSRSTGTRVLPPAELEDALARAVDWQEALRRVPWPQPTTVAARSQPRPPDRLPGRLRLEPIGRYGSRRVIVQGTIVVPIAQLERSANGQFDERVTVLGDITRAGRFVLSFSTTHVLSGRPPTGDGENLELDFYRVLDPGDYEIAVRVINRLELPLLRDRRELSVPTMQEAASPPLDRRGGFARLTRDDLVLLTNFPTVELLSPIALGDQQQQVLASAHGGAITAVEFKLGDSPEATWIEDSTPPFRYTFETTRPQPLYVRALDDTGKTVSSAHRIVWPSDRPFRLWLDQAPSTTLATLREIATRGIAGRLDHPHDQEIERIDCLLGGRIFATLKDPTLSAVALDSGAASSRSEVHGSSGAGGFRCPPFTEALNTSSGRSDVAVLSAVATLDNGATASDTLVFSRHPIDQVDVQLNQFAISVVGSSGAPLIGLDSSDFVLSSTLPTTTVSRVEPIDRLPLTLSLLLDTSSSMGRRLRVTAASCRRFFDSLLRQEDSANLLAFNHDIRVLMNRTSNKDQLRYAASGLSSFGATRVYDAIMHSISSFQSQGQRRAIVVLTDGADTESDFAAAQVEREALRAGITIYAIALGELREPYRSELSRLAEATGGQLHTARTASQLDVAFSRIAELLRSSYLITLENDSVPLTDDQLDQLKVEVRQPGARVSALTRLTAGG